MLEALALAGLAEVVVTAQRRDEPWLEARASITRIDTSARTELGHYAEVLNAVPGVLVQRGSGQESLIALRSPVLTGAGACGAFLLLEDGLPLRPTGFCNVNQMFESNTAQAAAIEVLRGTATPLYGANAVHGVIQVLTPQVAELDPYRIGLRVGADRFRSIDVSVAGDAYAAYGNWRKDGGFRDDSPVEEWKLNLLHDRDLNGGQLRLRLASTRLDQRTAGFIRGLDAYRDDAVRRSNPNPEAFRKADSLRLSAIWRGEPCEGCRNEYRAVLRDSSMSFLQHFLLGKPLETNAQRSALIGAAQTRDLAISGLAFGWGLDAEWAETELLEIQAGPTLEGSAIARAIRPAGRHYDYATRVTGVALHVGLERERERYGWRLGLRADRSQYDYDNRMRDGNTAEDGTPCAFGGCLFSRPADRRDAFENLTPRFDLNFKLDDRQRLYFAASNGFRPPEISELYRLQRMQQVADLSAEHMQALEIGWRYSSSHWRGHLALYEQQKRDLILRDANGFNFTAGRTSHRGLEWEWRWRPHEFWELSWSGTLARHRYEFSAALEGGETWVAGNDVDTAPRRLQHASIKWLPSSRSEITLQWQDVGAYFADAANLHRYPGHSVADARFAHWLNDSWRLSLDLQNLTDRRYADRADYAQGSWRYFPGRARSGYLTLEWRTR